MVGDNTEGIFLLCVGGLGGIGMGLGPGGQPINANRLSGGGGMSAMGPGGQSPFEILGLNYIQYKVCHIYAELQQFVFTSQYLSDRITFPLVDHQIRVSRQY